jgi:hypothetical protein
MIGRDAFAWPGTWKDQDPPKDCLFGQALSTGHWDSQTILNNASAWSCIARHLHGIICNNESIVLCSLSQDLLGVDCLTPGVSVRCRNSYCTLVRAPRCDSRWWLDRGASRVSSRPLQLPRSLFTVPIISQPGNQPTHQGPHTTP